MHLIYDNSDREAYYCPELVKLFYTSIDQASINIDTYQVLVHLPTRDMCEFLQQSKRNNNVPGG